MLTGHLDHVGIDRIAGWARDEADPARRLVLELYDGDRPIVRFVADRMRTDLAGAGLGDGRYGFWLSLPAGLFPMPVHRIGVRFVDTGADIGGSPRHLYRADPALDEDFSAFVDAQMDAAIAAAERPEQLEPLIAFATSLTSRLVGAIDRFDTLNRSTPLRDIALSTLPDRLRRSADKLAGGPKPVHVPLHPDPRVSVVVASSGRLGDDHGLIRSLVETSTGIPLEIIVVDNSGVVETTLLPFLLRGGARVVRLARPAPAAGSAALVAAYAEGQRLARGEILVFLSGLAGLAGDALATLVETLDRAGPSALVAPRLVDADGLVRSAGLAVDPLGNKSPVGQGADAALTRFRVLRPADDVALNAVVVRREALLAQGGFEAQEGLEDYAVTDLAFALRAGGGAVLVQGAAEAVLAGPLAGMATKSAGRSRFLTRWTGTLPRIGEEAAGEARTVLFIDEHFPAPEEDAGSVAVFSHARAFVRLGYRVVFVATEQAGHAAVRARRLRARGIEAEDGIGSMEQFLATRANQFDVVYVHRFHVARQVLEAARGANPKAKILFSLADLHHVREERAQAVTGMGDGHAIAATRADELAAIAAADVTITHSDWERDYIAGHLPAARVVVALWDLPAAAVRAPFAERRGLCFLGSYRHAPNGDAIAHFMTAVWPRTAEAVRQDGLDIVGAYTDALKLGALPDDIRLAGYVADIAAYLDGKRLMVAPLRFGAGVKGKVLLALSQGLPCIMSPVAAEGIPLSAELAEALVAADDDALRARIEALYADPVRWQAVSEAAVDWARRTLSEAAVTSALAEALADVPAAAGPDRAPEPVAAKALA